MATEKDILIIRQSQLKLCLEYFHMCGVCPTLADTIRISKMLEEYVLKGYSSTIHDSFLKIDKYIQKEYKGK